MEAGQGGGVTAEALPGVEIQAPVAAVCQGATRKPPPGVRTDLAVPAELASQPGHGKRFLAEPRAVSGESRRARSVARPTTRA